MKRILNIQSAFVSIDTKPEDVPEKDWVDMPNSYMGFSSETMLLGSLEHLRKQNTMAIEAQKTVYPDIPPHKIHGYLYRVLEITSRPLDL